MWKNGKQQINPLNAELNSICHLLALLGVHHILHVGRIRVNHDINSIKFSLVARRFNSARPFTKPSRIYACLCVYILVLV